jgi:hypothetical protein
MAVAPISMPGDAAFRIPLAKCAIAGGNKARRRHGPDHPSVAFGQLFDGPRSSREFYAAGLGSQALAWQWRFSSLIPEHRVFGWANEPLPHRWTAISGFPPRLSTQVVSASPVPGLKQNFLGQARPGRAEKRPVRDAIPEAAPTLPSPSRIPNEPGNSPETIPGGIRRWAASGSSSLYGCAINVQVFDFRADLRAGPPGYRRARSGGGHFSVQPGSSETSHSGLI